MQTSAIPKFVPGHVVHADWVSKDNTHLDRSILSSGFHYTFNRQFFPHSVDEGFHNICGNVYFTH